MAKKKIISKVAASSVILSMVLAAGCNGNGSIPGLPGSKATKQAKVIEEDTPWYDATCTVVEPDIVADPSKELEYSSAMLIGQIGANLLFRVNGSYKVPDDFDWENGDYSEYTIDTVCTYDSDSNTLEPLVDLTETYSGSYSGVDSIQIKGDELVVSIYEYDPNTWEESQSEFTIDPETGAYTDPVPVESSSSEDVSRYLEKSITLSDTSVDFYYVYDYTSGESTYEIYAGDEQIKLNVDDEIYGFQFVFPISETKALGKAWTEGSDIYIIVDIEAGTAEKADDKDYEWLNDAGDLYDGIVGEDGKMYTVTNQGIYVADFEAKEITQALDFSFVGISSSKLRYNSLISYSEDKIILGGTYYAYTAYDNSWSGEEYQIITLTKADKNPNVGKSILELYVLGGYPSDVTYDAITDYNTSDKDYFIQVTNKYDVEKYYEGSYNADSSDEWAEASLDMMAGISDELAVDLINGEGPDIILDAAALGQLNNENYLTDLSSYVKDLSSDEYFTNIIDASYTGDKLYQIPLAFCVNGIQTSSDNAGASGVGFTLDEYVDFVDDACNGTDPIASGQNMYFLTLFNENSAKFIKDGKVDFTGEEFAALAEYCKDNAPEKSASWSDSDDVMPYGMYNEETTYAAMDVSSHSLGSYFDNLTYIEGRGDAILGYPSVDGQGPSAAPLFSAAISSSTVSVDGCWDFIKTLLSEEIQETIANNGYNPVNRAAFDSVGDKAVDYYNDMYSDEYFYGMGVGEPSTPDKFSDEDVDAYKKIVESVTTVNTSDASISKIISEEMPAYFSGQKDLDEVVKILQDRVQKVLDERG